MPTMTPFLTFERDAEAAIDHWVSVVPDAKILMTRRWGEGGPAPKGTLMAATIELAGQRFMVLNGGPKTAFNDSFSFFLQVDTQEEIDTLSARLIEGGGKLTMCGWLEDRWGARWQIVPRVLDEILGATDKARAGRAMQALMQMQKIDIAALKKAYEGA